MIGCFLQDLRKVNVRLFSFPDIVVDKVGTVVEELFKDEAIDFDSRNNTVEGKEK
jgi:hypothetical protein